MATKINTGVVQVVRAMVEAQNLASKEDAGSFLGGVLDGLASLVSNDAAGVYLVNRAGRRFRYTMMRGCELLADLEAASTGRGFSTKRSRPR